MTIHNLRKTVRQVFSVAMAAAVIISTVPTAFAAGTGDAIGDYSFTISNPYGSVNWDTWKTYRAATHVHTVRSDGNVEVDDMIEDYYAHGYQCLALTDHGTVNYSWHKKQTRLAIFDYQFFVHGALDILSDARYEQITTGSDRGGDGMIEIPLGIELNGSSTSKCHVNSYFADCGHGDLELTAKWPEDAVKKCEKAGGICHINHVGEWTDGKDDIGTYDTNFVNDFSKLFLNYKSCIGMELVNTKDSRTHNDRYLYDETLKITAPQGVPVWGFCEDDSHDPEDVGNNAQFFAMPQNTAENVRTSMETGAFFACSKTSKNAWELGDGFSAQGDFPMISRVEVDEEKDQITFYPYNGNKIKICADGSVLDEKALSGNNNPVTFDLNEYEDDINSYVRFYVTGLGGICYIQPFLLKKAPFEKSRLSFTLTPADTTVTVTDSAGEVVQPANENNEYVLPIDSYHCVFECSGYETVTQDIEITNNSTKIQLPVTMPRKLIFPRTENSAAVDYEKQFVFGAQQGMTKIRLPFLVIAADGVSVSYSPTPLGYGTGCVISASDASGNRKDYDLVLFGDLNGDGYYNGEDAVISEAINAGILNPEPCVGLAADCSRDGVYDGADTQMMSAAGLDRNYIISQQY